MSFEKPKLYNNNNELERKETLRFLLEYRNKITWKGSDTILDVGSGDGQGTAEIVKHFLPEDYKQLLGIDKSKHMVTFANDNYADDRVEFQVLDFSEDLPAHFVDRFDHVFSFYALNYITDQRRAYSQVYDVLAVGGDCLLSIVGDSPAYFSVYQTLANTKKWSPWVRDLEDHIPMYHGCKDAVSKATKLMKGVGFKDVAVKRITSSYRYQSEQHYKNFAEAISPFNIPTSLKKEYYEEFVKVAKENGFISQDLKRRFSLIYIFGRK